MVANDNAGEGGGFFVFERGFDNKTAGGPSGRQRSLKLLQLIFNLSFDSNLFFFTIVRLFTKVHLSSLEFDRPKFHAYNL